ncbi:MAG: hypothetical protein NVSMB62_03770 [Acidobacteriaceae bacterium]
MNFSSVEKIANAILYEGYILYPYRATAIKNRQRWNFGTLYPRIYAEAQRPQEPFRFTAECLLRLCENASLDVKLSFLQHLPQDPGSPADKIQELSDPSLGWDVAVERTVEFCSLPVLELARSQKTLSAAPAPDLHVQLRVGVSALPSGASRLHIELENVARLASGSNAKRDDALPLSLVSAHLLLGMSSGEFISLLEPPEEYSADAKSSTNSGVFPVLAGDKDSRSLMLVSPIILYDYPQIAPESQGDFFDGTEMDEMLTLRVLTLTDAEKEEMRSGDLRARRILERTEALTNEEMLQAHGIIRQMRNPRHVETQGGAS